MELRQTYFNVSTAKKIADEKLYGHIRTKSGYNVRIVDWKFCGRDGYTLVGAIWLREKGVEILQRYNIKGIAENSQNADLDLVLFVPHDYIDYSDYVPTKYESCVTFNNLSSFPCWSIEVCAKSLDKENKIKPTFFVFDYTKGVMHTEARNIYLPLTDITFQLLGTFMTYEELFTAGKHKQ